MNWLLAAILLVVLALAWLIYESFTKRGAIPLDKALKDFTSWAGLVCIALADWIVNILQWAAGLWDPLQAQFGTLFANPSLSAFVQLMSFVFLLLKFKGQTPLPKPSFPSPGASPG